MNRINTGLSTGTREPSITSFAQNMYYFGTVICDWGSLRKDTYPFAILIGSVILIALIGMLLFKAIKSK